MFVHLLLQITGILVLIVGILDHTFGYSDSNANWGKPFVSYSYSFATFITLSCPNQLSIESSSILALFGSGTQTFAQPALYDVHHNTHTIVFCVCITLTASWHTYVSGYSAVVFSNIIARQLFRKAAVSSHLLPGSAHPSHCTMTGSAVCMACLVCGTAVKRYSTNVTWPMCVALKGWSITVCHLLVHQRWGQKWSRNKKWKERGTWLRCAR